MQLSGVGIHACSSTNYVQILLDKGADARAETSDGDSALAAAISGVPDIDKFTLGKCQTATVAALLDKAPDLTLKDNFYGRAARLAARASGCSDVLSLIERKRTPRIPLMVTCRMAVRPYFVSR